MHKFDVAKRKKLNSDERKKVLPPEKILNSINLKTGDTFADVGCGTGFFAIPASKVVGIDGTVYALDISSKMLEETEKNAKANSITNINTVLTQKNYLEIGNNSVDISFCSTVIHEVEDKKSFISEMVRILKPNGRIAIVDFEKKESDFGPPLDHRVSSDEVKSLINNFSLRDIKTISINENFYIVMGNKSELVSS